MDTIMELKLTLQQYNLLKELQNELLTQNNRCSRNPIYLVRHKVERVCVEGCGEERYYIDDSSLLNKSEMIEYIFNDENLSALFFSFLSGESIDEDIISSEVNAYITKEVIDEKFDELYEELGIQKINIELEDEVVSNGACFSFFEKDAFEHIQLNGHNISGSKFTYADSLYRAPRMEKLLELLTNIKL